MRLLIGSIILVMGGMIQFSAHGASSVCTSAICLGTEVHVTNRDPDCTSYEDNCYIVSGSSQRRAYQSCTQCAPGYFITPETVTCGTSTTITYNRCCVDCVGQEFEPVLQWESVSVVIPGLSKPMRLYAYQQAEKKECDCKQGWVTTYVYRCAPGYYGTAKKAEDGTFSGCDPCPGDDKLNELKTGNSEPGNFTRIDSCYVLDGNDDTGNYEYAQKCYYLSL